MKDIVAGFREVIKDLLVPELKAIQVELQLHSKILEKLTKDVEDMKIGQARLEEGQEKILDKLDLDKRLTRIETIIERAGLSTVLVREKKEKYKTK